MKPQSVILCLLLVAAPMIAILNLSQPPVAENDSVEDPLDRFEFSSEDIEDCQGDQTIGGCHLITGEWWEPTTYLTSPTDHDGDGIPNVDDAFPLNPVQPASLNSRQHTNCLHSQPGNDCASSLVSTGFQIDDHFNLPSNSIIASSSSWGDVDGDGDLDLLLGSLGANSLHLNQDGIIQQTPHWTEPNVSGGGFVQFLDADADGDLDVGSGSAEKASIYENNQGEITEVILFELPDDYLSGSLIWNDVNMDGGIDLTAVTADGVDIFMFGEEELEPSPSIHLSITRDGPPTSVTWADVDGGGGKELFLAYSNQPNMLLSLSGTTLTLVDDWRPLTDFYEDWPDAVVIDMDEDGYDDLVRSSYSGLLLFKGGVDGFPDVGEFISSDDYTHCDASDTPVTGDVDGNGLLDLVCVSWSDYSITFQYPTGWSSIVERQVLPEDSNTAVAMLDYDGDGLDDLVIADWDGGIQILENIGSAFSKDDVLFSYSGAGHIADFVALDFDNDGDTDIAFSGDEQTRVFENVAGTLQEFTAIQSTATRAQLTWEDFDQNGISDLIVNANGDDDAYFIQTDGSVIVQDLSSLAYFDTVISGDFNGDGAMDLLWSEKEWIDSEYTQYAAYITFDEDSGEMDLAGYQVPFDYFYDESNGLLSGDINGDGMDDVVITGSEPSDTALLSDGSMIDFLNPLSWTPQSDLAFYLGSVDSSDIDGDGFEDIIIRLSRDRYDPLENDNDFIMFKGSSSGLEETLTPLIDIKGVGDTEPQGMLLIDIDGDQDMDLLAIMEAQDVLFANDDGEFTRELWIEPANGGASSILGASGTDYDSDGDIDLFLFGGTATILKQVRGTTQYDFQIYTPDGLDDEGNHFSVTDIEHDGNLEVLTSVGLFTAPENAASEIQGEGFFDSEHPWRMLKYSPIGTETGELCDLEGDGFHDLVYLDEGSYDYDTGNYLQNLVVHLGGIGGISPGESSRLLVAEDNQEFHTLTCYDFEGDGSDEVILSSTYSNLGVQAYDPSTNTIHDLFPADTPRVWDIAISEKIIAFAAADTINIFQLPDGIGEPSQYHMAFGGWSTGWDIPHVADGLVFADLVNDVPDPSDYCKDLIFWEGYDFSVIIPEQFEGVEGCLKSYYADFNSYTFTVPDYSGGYIQDIKFADINQSSDAVEVVVASGNGFHVGACGSGGADFSTFQCIFSGPLHENTSKSISHIELADIDSDGLVDLIVSELSNDGKVFLHWNNGGVLDLDGIPFLDEEGRTKVLAQADNEDGRKLLLILRDGNSNSEQGYSYVVGWDETSYPVEDWTSTMDIFSEDDQSIRSSAWADIDGDGWTDLVTIAGGDLMLYFNEQGQLENLPSQRITVDWSAKVELADIDGDGNLDALVYVGQDEPLRVYSGTGSGFSTTNVWTSADVVRAADIAFADYDDDGDLDLAIGVMPISYGDISFGDDGFDVLYRNEDGVLSDSPVWTSPVSTITSSIAWGDVDGDGVLELAIDGWQSIDMIDGAIIFNQDSPTLIYSVVGGTLSDQPTWESDDSGFANHILWFDIDSDSDLDLVVSAGLFEFGGGMHAFLNENGVLSTQKTILSGQFAGVTHSLAADLDSNGGMDLLIGISGGFAIAWSAVDDDLDGVPDDVDQYLDNPSQAHNSDNDPYGDNPDGLYPDSCPIVSGESWRDRWGCADEDRDGQSNLYDDFWIRVTQWKDTDGDGLGDNWGDSNWNGTRGENWPGEYIEGAFDPDVSPLDRDNDGYEDESLTEQGANDPLDDCPKQWGSSFEDSRGCPDTDDDGWSDEADSHPNDRSQHLDSDGDGWGDDPAGLNGDRYPSDSSQWKDSDGDLFGDNPSGTEPDAYPLDPSQWNDTDSDGFGDNPFGNAPDFCPLLAGDSTKDVLGCHDGDGDGWSNLSDFDDMDAQVWSDSDGDGFPDQLASNISDDCPGQVGASSRIMRGCPDMDADGMPDIFDDDADGDGISNSMEREASRGEHDWDPYDATSTPPDLDGDRIPDIVDLDDDDDGFPDEIENERGSDSMDAASTPLNMFGEGDTGFYYVPGNGFQSGYSDDGYEISLSAVMSLVTSEYLIPIILMPISLLLLLRKRRRFKKFRKRLNQAQHNTELDQLEEDLDDLIEGGKIRVEHGLLLRNQYERMREQVSSGISSSSRPPGRRGLAGGGQQSKKGYGASGGSVMSPPSRRRPPDRDNY